jgi:hypothetical protein
MEYANLCQCNKCNIVLIDQNPQTNAPEYIIKGLESEMRYIEDTNGGYWVCPICNTDDNLQDNITIAPYSLADEA